MALGVRARVGVGVGAVLGLSAAVAVVWFAASTANPSTVRYVNGSAPATAPPPPPENPAPGAGEEQEGERDAEAAPEPFSLPLRRSKRATTVGADTSDVTAIVYDDRCMPHTRFLQDCNTCLCPTSGIRARASCTCPWTASAAPPASPTWTSATRASAPWTASRRTPPAPSRSAPSRPPPHNPPAPTPLFNDGRAPSSPNALRWAGPSGRYQHGGSALRGGSHCLFTISAISRSLYDFLLIAFLF
ncbi:Protein of unknown function [Gryllus bimaculatus]|nr:Protein of unknown function [Gryllus bimaculatus]